MTASPREIARELGGKVSGRSVLAPGPGHSARDRSLSVTLSAATPRGFLVNSFAGDDPLCCLDHVRARLGLQAFTPRAQPRERTIVCRQEAPDESKRNADMAAWLWSRREPVSESNAADVYLRKRRYERAFPPTLGYLPASGKQFLR